MSIAYPVSHLSAECSYCHTGFSKQHLHATDIINIYRQITIIVMARRSGCLDYFMFALFQTSLHFFVFSSGRLYAYAPPPFSYSYKWYELFDFQEHCRQRNVYHEPADLSNITFIHLIAAQKLLYTIFHGGGLV